jgi:hypothetical protein
MHNEEVHNSYSLPNGGCTQLEHTSFQSDSSELFFLWGSNVVARRRNSSFCKHFVISFSCIPYVLS